VSGLANDRQRRGLNTRRVAPGRATRLTVGEPVGGTVRSGVGVAASRGAGLRGNRCGGGRRSRCTRSAARIGTGSRWMWWSPSWVGLSRSTQVRLTLRPHWRVRTWLGRERRRGVRHTSGPEDW